MEANIISGKFNERYKKLPINDEYSGETANGNIGHNLPESRQFFNNEKDAYYDAVIELMVLI